MELIVAVYDDWGIGADGTQPIALSADRIFFRVLLNMRNLDLLNHLELEK